MHTHTHTHTLPLVTANPYVDIVSPGDILTINQGNTFVLQAITLYTVTSGAQAVAAQEDVTVSAKDLGIDLTIVSVTTDNPYQL